MLYSRKMVRLCTTPFWVRVLIELFIISFFLNSIIIQDKNLTSSPYPYLTECFRDTALQWVAMGIFWVVLPLWIRMLIRRQIQPQPLPITLLFVAKMVKICVYFRFMFFEDREGSLIYRWTVFF